MSEENLLRNMYDFKVADTSEERLVISGDPHFDHEDVSNALSGYQNTSSDSNIEPGQEVTTLESETAYNHRVADYFQHMYRFSRNISLR